MLKKYYGVEEAVEYLSELHKQRISKRDVLELGVRGDIRLCFWVDGVITKFKDNFEGAEFVGGGGSFRGYALIPPLHISLKGKMSGIRSLEIVEVVDYDSTRGSDQLDKIEWPEIYSVYKCSEETGAITPVSQTVKTKAILIPAIDLLNLSSITKSTSKHLGDRAETTYLNIIAALIDVISNGIPDSEAYILFNS